MASPSLSLVAPTIAFAVTAEAIEAAVTPRSKVLMLNFPTNPTGGTMTRTDLLKIAGSGVAAQSARHYG
jgi:aspartate/methionine/tyrosine aminotransferase